MEYLRIIGKKPPFLILKVRHSAVTKGFEVIGYIKGYVASSPGSPPTCGKSIFSTPGRGAWGRG